MIFHDTQKSLTKIEKLAASRLTQSPGDSSFRGRSSSYQTVPDLVQKSSLPVARNCITRTNRRKRLPTGIGWRRGNQAARSR